MPPAPDPPAAVHRAAPRWNKDAGRTRAVVPQARAAQQDEADRSPAVRSGWREADGHVQQRLP